MQLNAKTRLVEIQNSASLFIKKVNLLNIDVVAD